MCHGKNKADVDIDDALKSLPTTQKAVANSIVKSGVAKNTDKSRHIFINKCNACLHILVLMLAK